MPFDKDTYNLFESYIATFPNTQNHNKPSNLNDVKDLSDKKEHVATKLDVKGQGSDEGEASNTPVEDEETGARTEIAKFFQWMGDLSDQDAKSDEFAIENYLQGNTDEVAANLNILDDDIADYEAEWGELLEHGKQQVMYVFKKYPQELANMFPGLTVDKAVSALDNWIDKSGY
jgi:hypothetical protein